MEVTVSATNLQKLPLPFPYVREKVSAEDPRYTGIPGEPTLDPDGKLMKTFIRFAEFTRFRVQRYNTFVQRRLQQIIQLWHITLPTGRVVFDTLSVTPPVYISSDGSTQPMYPNICRLQNATYKMGLYCNFKFIPNDGSAPIIREKQSIGSMPIMLGSDYCLLRRDGKMDPNWLLSHGEDPDDPMGYFIADGVEQTMPIQEMLRVNRMFNFAKDSKGTLVSYMTCATIAGTRVVQLFITPTGEIRLSLAGFKKNSSGKPNVLGVFQVFRLFYTVYFPNKSYSLDTFLEYILLFTRKDKRWRLSVIAKLAASSFDYDSVGDDIGFLADIMQLPGPRSGATVKEQQDNYEARKRTIMAIFDEELFPQLNSEPEKMRPEYRLMMFGKMVANFAEFLSGLQSIDNRDDYGNKRMETDAPLMEQLFRTSWRWNVIEDLQRKINNLVTKDLAAVVRNFPRSAIENDFENSFTSGKWGVRNISVQENYVQRLKRDNMTTTYSQMTLIDVKTSRNDKQITIRCAQGSQWGLICPVETPEGENIGIVKHMACTAYVSDDQEHREIDIKAIIARTEMEAGIISAGDLAAGRTGVSLHPTDKQETLLNINGKYLGWVGGKRCLQALRVAKRGQKLPFDLCIVLDRSGTLNVYCDGGRLLHPVLIVNKETGKLVIDELGYREKDFNTLLTSGCVEYLDAWEQSVMDDILISESVATLESSKKIIEELREELSDNQLELAEALRQQDEQAIPTLARRINKIQKALENKIKNSNYSHCEMDPTAMLGIAAAIIPHPEMNQSARNTFQAGMSKQALSIYHANQLNRFDGSVKVLAYPTRPLFETQMAAAIGMGRRPQGQTVTLAFGTAGGWDQEDALQFNKMSLEPGKFRMLKYFDKETIVSGNANFNEVVQRPEPREGEAADTYDAIDLSGMPIPGSYVRQGQCVTGKIRTYNKGGKGPMVVNASTYMEIGEEGRIDNISICTNKKGEKVVVVRIRSVRQPIVADKFSARESQKGTLGLIPHTVDMMFSEKTGLAPDVIANPHSMPTRMTMEYLKEILASKAGALIGEFQDATPFRRFDEAKYGDVLRSFGFQPEGYETFINGKTGKRITNRIFVGPVFWQALRHHVYDKIQMRNTGAIKAGSHQPPSGRASGGAVRFGEMEKNGGVSHGASGFIQERLMAVSDAFPTVYCITCGVIAVPLTKIDPEIQGPGTKYSCRRCGTKGNFGKITVPYGFLRLIRHLGTSGFFIRSTLVKAADYHKIREQAQARRQATQRADIEEQELDEETKEEIEAEDREEIRENDEEVEAVPAAARADITIENLLETGVPAPEYEAFEDFENFDENFDEEEF